MWSHEWGVFGLRGEKVTTESPWCWPRDVLCAIKEPHAVLFRRIGRFGWRLDAAEPPPDQSIVVGSAEFDPGFHAGQIVFRNLVGFNVAVLVLAV
jgi:hypothetical protein